MYLAAHDILPLDRHTDLMASQPTEMLAHAGLSRGTVTAAVSLLVLSLALGACSEPDDRPGVTIDYYMCPEEDCGVNASTLNDLFFGENHLRPGENAGDPNPVGARIVDFVPADDRKEMTLFIERGSVRATDGMRTIMGVDMRGSKIVVEDTRDGSLTDVYFHEARLVETWTERRSIVAQYVFAYRNVNGDFVSVCSEASDLSDEAAWSVLLTRERYSVDDRAIVQEDADGIFNIACQGSALYKMKMAGYEPDLPTDAPSYTVADQRQAAIKMFTADYCGTGQSFTEDGIPLQWSNSTGSSRNTTNPVGEIEAYWDAGGALCLDTPRLGTDTLDAIRNECASAGKTLPSCTDFDGAYEWVTHVVP